MIIGLLLGFFGSVFLASLILLLMGYGGGLSPVITGAVVGSSSILPFLFVSLFLSLVGLLYLAYVLFRHHYSLGDYLDSEF